MKYRDESGKPDDYGKIELSVVNDERLSYRAIGVYYAMRNGETFASMVESGKDQAGRILSALKELAECGYIASWVAEEAEESIRVVRRDLASNYAEYFLMLVRRDGPTCVFCGAAVRDLEIDHILPVSRGGDNSPPNLRLLCPDCNKKRNCADGGAE